MNDLTKNVVNSTYDKVERHISDIQMCISLIQSNIDQKATVTDDIEEKCAFRTTSNELTNIWLALEKICDKITDLYIK